MSNKIENPTKKSGGFAWALVALIVIAAVVIGFIVWKSKANHTTDSADLKYQNVSMTASLEDDGVVLKSDNAKSDAPSVELYEDFSCHACSDLAKATDEKMKEKIESGDLIVTVRTMNFLDKGQGIGHSTRALAAVLSILDSKDAKLYWNYRSMLLEQFAQIAGQWKDEDFAKAAEKMGASSSVVKSIKKGENTGRAEELAKRNIDTLKDHIGIISSPHVLRDGEEAVSRDDLLQWIDKVVGS